MRALLAFLILGLSASPAAAFDYLEHSYFSDRACLAAQRVIGGRISAGQASDAEIIRYLALAVVCPNAWDKPYCAGELKQSEANINRLAPGGEQSLTFGDFSSLGDHVSSFGPVRGLPPPAAGQDGLLGTVFRYMAAEPMDAGGVIGDVQDNACESTPVPWARVESDTAAYLEAHRHGRVVEPLSQVFLSPLSRSAVTRGPYDPAGVYSFDNPHFLDMVLNDRNHFAERAHMTWLGFHSTAVDIARSPCESVVGFDEDTLEDLAEGLSAYEDLEWDGLPDRERRSEACDMLADIVRRRVLEWSERAAGELVAPIGENLSRLGSMEYRRVVPAVMALVFEGAGLHFLQDGLSAGHLRTPESLQELEDRRYTHDFDNRQGLAAIVHTPAGMSVTVLFGDSYLLGESHAAAADCTGQSALTPEQVSDCLVGRQRGLLVAAGAASLLHWAQGGALYHDETAVCPASDAAQAWICNSLPIVATRPPGIGEANVAARLPLIPTALPVPPPPLSYQSLAFNAAMDAAGSGNQIGLDMAFYATLGSSDWLRSYRIGVRVEEGPPENRQFNADFAYGFHWRWAARFLLDAEPFVYAGILGSPPKRAFISGVGPKVGMTALPEGWIKMPLELSLSYRLPLRMYDARYGFFGRSFAIEAHWLQFSLGLAFM